MPAALVATILTVSWGLVLAGGTASATTPGTGQLAIIAGTGTTGPPTPGLATSSQLYYPFGVAVDSSGNVYIADTANNQVETVTSAGVLSIFAGTGNPGAPTPGPAISSNLTPRMGWHWTARGTCTSPTPPTTRSRR
jgi:hypothetical protein